MERGIFRFSTDGVAAAQRLDYWADVLRSAVTPMSIARVRGDGFESRIAGARLGPLSVMLMSGSPHSALRTPADIAKNSERSFHLAMSLDRPWTVVCRGRVRMEPGDVMLFDTRFEHDLGIPDPYRFVNIKMPPEWVRNWGPMIDGVVGRRIAGDGSWGRVLASYMMQLSPDFIVRSPLPEALLADQLGALLALAANEMSATAPLAARRERSLGERVAQLVLQRCSEPALVAADVAAALEVSPRTLHRALAARGETFGRLLLEARAQLALRMLTSKPFGRVNVAEIGRRAGFVDASHFARVIRRRTGRTPLQVRKSQD